MFPFVVLGLVFSVLRQEIGCLPYFHTWCGLSANLECRSEMCCTWLAGNAGPHKIAIWAQSHNFVGLYLRNWGTYRQSEKKLVKLQYLLDMSLQYGELRFTSSWDRFVSFGHPCKFQWVSRLGSVTARHSSIGRWPNFAALNTGRHLYSSGRPSRWVLAHISSFCVSWRYKREQRLIIGGFPSGSIQGNILKTHLTYSSRVDTYVCVIAIMRTWLKGFVHFNCHRFSDC